ncbi:MAG: pilus assembly PilX N-terminal domain-containing protein [Candidatus Omnitrophota bacterium]
MDDRILKRRGSVLIVTFLVITVLVILSVSMLARIIGETRSAERHKESTEAFYLAEAAIDKAIAKLPSNSDSETGVSLGTGKYSLTIYTIEAGKKWKVVGEGFVPDVPPNARANYRIEAFLQKKDLDDNFWSNAIYSAGNVSFTGTAYSVTGDVRYAGSISGEGNIPLENIKPDPSISPLALLDFDYLKQIAISQNNYYPTVDRPLPTSFWYNPTEGVPNVVYIETDLIMHGTTSVGGFVIVGGNIVQNVEITGNASINGCVYTRGYFKNLGGGSSLNVNGSVWAGNYVDLRGSITAQYNQAYMDAIRNNINPGTEVQIISWRKE